MNEETKEKKENAGLDKTKEKEKETFAVVRIAPDRSYAFASRSSEYARDKLEGGAYSEPGESFEDLLRRVRWTVKKVFEEEKA